MNYIDILNEYVLDNLGGVKLDNKVFVGKACADATFKRKIAELNFFSLINCHPEVVEQALKNLKYIYSFSDYFCDRLKS